MLPNPASKAHGFAMRSISLGDMQIYKSEKKNLGPPPLPNPGDAPAMRMISMKNNYLSIYNSQLIKCELYHTEKHFRKNKNSAMNVISKTLSEMHLKCSREHHY